MSSDLAARVDALERRVNELERDDAPPVPVPHHEGFWALAGLKARAPEGAVLYTGAVTLPTGETYEWQSGQPAAELLEADWPELAAELATTLGALGQPVRLLILGLVLTGAGSVAELQENESLGTSGQLYHHLRQLVAAGWLRPASRGHYAVPAERVIPLLAILTAAQH